MLLIASYSICAVCFLAFLLFVLARREGGKASLPIVLSIAGTVLWATAGVAVAGSIYIPATVLEIANGLRAGLWLWFVYSLRALSENDLASSDDVRSSGALWFGGGLVAVKLIVSAAALSPAFNQIVQSINAVAGLAIAVAGLVLVENIYQQSGQATRWAVKHLLIATGTLFAFDLFRYADSLLIHQLSSITLGAQPIISVMVIPLLAVGIVRIRSFAINIHVSRDVVLGTSALVASGVYLLVVAASGYLIRYLEWDWGGSLQLVFLVGAFLILVVLLGSGEIRAHGRHFIERSFFSFAYDYRKVWLRFVETMAGGNGKQSLHERAIQAIADPLDCSCGCLYLRGRDDQQRFVIHWNWSDAISLSSIPDALGQQFEINTKAIDLRDQQNHRLISIAWLTTLPGAWIAVPLTNRDRCIGVVVLGKPRISRSLTWEDLDLLNILSAQVGGYIAEEQLTHALTEAQRFEWVSKNFSFVAHDLKNIVTQLSLVLQQAQRHANNPEFVEDTLLTVKESVDKMQTMLLRLRDNKETIEIESVDLQEMLRSLPGRKRFSGKKIEISCPKEDIIVRANSRNLWVVMENLLDNALEATDPVESIVVVALERYKENAVIAITDQGKGMSASFIENQLFQPFVSTKPTGFGIGMYQCREWIERCGGRLEIDSEPDKGTTARILLPLYSPESDA